MEAFAGVRVLVAGGSRGIGLGIARAFAGAGAAVSICARDPQGLREAAALLSTHGGQVHWHACDLADPAAVAAYVEAAATALGGLDVVVNNASGFGNGVDDASWQAGFDVDLMAAVRCSRAALPHLRRSSQPVILNISSINGLRPTPRTPAYSAAKAALNYYTVTLATELARERIRVNAIAPGSIEFPGGVWDQRKTADPKLYQGTLRSIPWGRFGAPEEIATVAVFLLSERAGWVTGQTLSVDGGQNL